MAAITARKMVELLPEFLFPPSNAQQHLVWEQNFVL
jgi:hypothetical protein